MKKEIMLILCRRMEKKRNKVRVKFENKVWYLMALKFMQKKFAILFNPFYTLPLCYEIVQFFINVCCTYLLYFIEIFTESQREFRIFNNLEKKEEKSY